MTCVGSISKATLRLANATASNTNQVPDMSSDVAAMHIDKMVHIQSVLGLCSHFLIISW